ncbi:MDR family MFS transporter [Dactylosporangium sp. NPDC048998]|uniref:MDR family MFS transporter n=1 Tax=Dactylosporangium sp. NPDC048998 TaxID=3363976 RepID=UPI003719F3A5
MREATFTGRSGGVGLRSERGPVLGSVMLTTGLVALDSTIIATAVPSVVRDLGGFAHFPWLFSIYLLTAAVTTPLCGKLADVLGRKPVMLFGIVAFLVGSVLCGAAWSMLTLIVFRAVQGIGAGAIQPISMTIIGDLYTVQERARVQGYVAGVWGVASVVGPTLGGVFSEYLSWRWIFYVNVPLGLIAAWMLARHLKESVARRRHRIDYLGAALLIGGCTLLILGTLEGGITWAWLSAPSVIIFVLGAALITAFVFVERRAAEPVLPLWVLRYRTLIGGNLAAVTVGALVIGLSSYVPNFSQGVLGTGALVAGFVVAAMTLGWPIAASLSGHVYLRIGFRNTALIGSLVIIGGTALCALLTEHTTVGMVSLACFVIGVGLGLASAPTLVAVQSVVGWDRRGVVTGTNMFSRSIGSAVGAAAFGAIANATLDRRFAAAPADVRPALGSGADATSIALQGGNATSAVADYVRASLFAATHNVFVALAVVGVCSLAVLLLIPRHIEELPPA